jgi:hypothetical protein
MKKAMGIGLGVVGLIVLVVAVASFRFSSIETPDYEVIETWGKVEVRRYPKCIVAQTRVRNASFKESGSGGFRVVAGYIFGGNESKQSISMTSPVVMEMGDKSTLEFVMPSKYRLEDLPQPLSDSVKIMEVAPRVLAVLRFGGFSSDKKIARYGKQLQEVLNSKQVKTRGNLLYMGYNAPWDVIGRRNEVAFELVE